MLTLESYQENRLIKFGILIFWIFYWLFNLTDKIIGSSSVLNILANQTFSFKLFICLRIILEAFSLLFVILALFYFILKRRLKARSSFLWMTFISLLAFTVFMVGDQVMGTGKGLLAYSTYWAVVLISWFLYKRSDEE